jgi:hypothetical protein
MRAGRVVVAAVAVAALAMGCSDGSNAASAGGSAATAPAPEDITTSPGAVLAGLQQIATIAAQVAAAGDAKVRASSLADQIEPVWQKIEGTIKAADQNAYLAFEDNFALITTGAESGDTAKVSQGVAGMARATSDYLAKHSG